MFIFDYLLWHYLNTPKKILNIWGNFLQFFILYFIPVPQLIKTLFSPWKRDITSYGRGFDFKRFFETLAFNIVSRFLGAIFRCITIIFALSLDTLIIFLGLAFFMFWLFWPFFIAGSLIYSAYLLFQPAMAGIVTLAIIIFDLVNFFAFIWLYKKSRQKTPGQMNLKEVFKQSWASIIWERLGIKPAQIPQAILDNPENSLDEFLKQNSIKKEDFSYVLEWQVHEEEYKYQTKKFWEKENLFTKDGIGRSWIYGWTNTLDGFSAELGKTKEIIHLIGRRDEVEAIGRILSRGSQSNVLLVGEPGVGKKTLIRQFARLVRQGRTASPLAYHRVLELDLNSALAGLPNEELAKERLIRIFNEASMAGNIILVINDLHNFVSPSKNIFPVIAPFLDGAYFQLIATTTYENLHNQIEKISALFKYFEKVEIKEPDLSRALLILQDNLVAIEKKTAKRITYQALKEIIKTANQYISGSPMPEKAVDLLEETAIYVATGTSDYFVLPKHVDFVVSQKTEIPVGELAGEEKEKLINLEEFLHQRVISQDAAIKEIASAMRRARMGVASTNRPMGNFLFLGPTGVGKTETAKALAQAYFGEESRMLRFDMSEYQGVTAVERMIGSPLTQAPGLLTTAVKENPFSLLLLDEIEKADPNILNLFLQVFDEGILTDAFGHKINFRNLIIIATSNAAAELIRQSVEQKIDLASQKQKILDYIQANGLFRTEFLNRLDGIIIFEPLTQEDIKKIARLNLEDLAKRLKSQEMIFIPSPALVEKIARLGYEPTFGARAMKRVTQDKVEDLIAKKMLKGEIQKNVPFEIKAEEI